MADITSEIAALQTATTGSAVRTALVDALTAINHENTWTADSTPTEGGTNPVTSGGAYAALQAVKQKVIHTDTVTLGTSWAGSGAGPYTQNVVIHTAAANSKIDLQPDETALRQLASDGVTSLWIENDNGVMTARAMGGCPSVPLTIQCTVVGANTDFGVYEGPYTVTPALTDRVLPTEDRLLTQDIVIEGYPNGRLIEKEITANGAYDPTDDSADGYRSVNVNVPNSYESSDEGKVVSSGALTVQSGRTVTRNGLYDTMLNDTVEVTVTGGGGIAPFVYEVGSFFGDPSGSSGASLSVALNGTAGTRAIIIIEHREAITVPAELVLVDCTVLPNFVQYISVYERVLDAASETYTVSTLNGGTYLSACVFLIPADYTVSPTPSLREFDSGASNYRYTVQPGQNPQLCVVSNAYASGSGTYGITPQKGCLPWSLFSTTGSAIRLSAFIVRPGEADSVWSSSNTGIGANDRLYNRIYVYDIVESAMAAPGFERGFDFVLPAVYRMVEYVTFDGYSFISPGVSGSDAAFEFFIKVKDEASDSRTRCCAGFRQAVTDGRDWNLRPKPPGGSDVCMYRGDPAYNYLVDADGDAGGILRYVCGINGYSAAGVHIGKYYDYTGSDGYAFVGRVYKAYMCAANSSGAVTMLRYLVPCYRVSDDVIGFYDAVTGSFFANEGTGNFGRGPDVA